MFLVSCAPCGSTVTIPAPCADPQATPDALDKSSLPPLTPQAGFLANSSASSLIPDPFSVPHHGEICDNSALFISAIADEAALLSSEETKERHQQPLCSTKQAENHVEELFGPLKQLFDEAHQHYHSPLTQQQDQDSSIWTHQQPPSVVKEDPFSVPVSIITQEEVEPPPDHWEDDITASLVPSAVLNIATQDQKTFSCIVESMPQEDVSTIPPQHVLLTCGEDLWQLFKDGKHQFSITVHQDDSSNLHVPSATVSDCTIDDFKVPEAPQKCLCKSPPSKEDDPFPCDEEWGDKEWGDTEKNLFHLEKKLVTQKKTPRFLKTLRKSHVTTQGMIPAHQCIF